MSGARARGTDAASLRALNQPDAARQMSDRGVRAWDKAGWCNVLDQAGRAQAQRQLPDLVVAGAADDGSAYAAAGRSGAVWWLAPDLMTRWEVKLAHPPLALALDPFGQYLAVSEAQGGVQILSRAGQPADSAQGGGDAHHRSDSG